MLDVCCPQHLPCNTSHGKGPPPPCASPEIYIALVLAAPVALIFWLRRNLNRPLLEQLPDEVPDQIPAIPEDLDAPTISSSITPPQAEAAYPSDGSGSSSGSDEKEDGYEAGRAELTPAFINATVDRSAYVGGILHKILNAFRGILLDINSSNESTIHPANGVLIQSMEIFYGNTDRVQLIFGTGDYTIEPYSVMFDCWVSKLEEDAESICQSEKSRRCIFLLNNIYDVWQMMRCQGAPFSNLELTSRLISMIQIYKKRYFDECWVPLLNNPCRLDKFTSDFVIICSRQMKWKVTAELKYKLRQEIVDLILPPYEDTLFALKANPGRLLKNRYCVIKRVMAGKKKQKKYTVQELEKVIRELFEG